MFGERLKSILQDREISQTKLADILNTTSQCVNRWCNNITQPDNDTIVEIAQFLGVSTDFLLGNDTVLSDYEQELREIEILKKLLIKVGYMTDDEDLSKKELENLMKMAKNNKDFIRENKQ